MQTENTLRVLIIDEHTVQIINSMLTKSEILLKGIINIQGLYEPPQEIQKSYPAIYFIQPNDTNIGLILKDHKKKRFKRFAIFFSGDPTEKQKNKLTKVKEPEIHVQNVNFNFICFDDNVFLGNISCLKNLAEIVGHNFMVYYLNEKERDEAMMLEEYYSTQGQVRRGDLLILNRVYDLITPLMRFFSFQGFLNDLGLMKKDVVGTDSFEHDKIWDEIRYEHIRDVNHILAQKASKLSEKNTVDNNMEVKDFLRAVRQEKQTKEVKEDVAVFLNLLDQCITQFENRNINFLSMTEQNIALKKDQNNAKYTKGVEDFFKICSDKKITIDDKIRMYLLLTVMGYDFQNREEQNLKNLGIITNNDIKAKEKLQQLRYLHISMKHGESKYVISRYEPNIKNLISNFVEERKGVDFICLTQSKEKEIESLRKSEFIYTKTGKKKKLVCVYIKNGITYEEMKVIHFLKRELGLDIILGSNEVLSHHSFIENINKI